jgi:hypothetical protein
MPSVSSPKAKGKCSVLSVTCRPISLHEATVMQHVSTNVNKEMIALFIFISSTTNFLQKYIFFQNKRPIGQEIFATDKKITFPQA